MTKTFGFIGTGNMGGALAKAAVKTLGNAVVLSNKTQEKAEALAAELGCQSAPVSQVAKTCDYIFLGVKPQIMPSLLSQLQSILAQRPDGFVLVSMAAGLTAEKIRTMAGGNYPVIRIMPNTPVAVGEGVILYDHTENVTEEMLSGFCNGMQHSGKLVPLPEKLIDAGSAVSGCGPAFVCMFIEALADGGVACGLPRQQALDLAAQTLLGTAKLMQETAQHPGALKDAVCSPGGSTIAGVAALEQGGFRAAVMNAVQDAFYRTQELGK